MRWWPRRTPKALVKTYPEGLVSIGDPRVAELFGIAPVDAGVSVTESSALGNSAFYRAAVLVAGELAMLPMYALADTPTGPQRQPSILDAPDGPDGRTAMEWRETAILHAFIHGDAFLLHRYTMAGTLYALEPLHPLTVAVEQYDPAEDEERPPGDRWYRVTLADRTVQRLTSRTVTQVPAPSMDGLRGMGLISIARQSLGVTIAADRAAGRVFGRGALFGGMATPVDDDLDPDEMDVIRGEIRANASGWEHAAAIRVFSRRLNFQPWTMTMADAQFLQSRQFQIEEIARWTGVPPVQLMQAEKQTSWGTGVAEQNRGLGRSVLAPWGTRFEQRLSRLVSPRRAFIDFGPLERPDPSSENAIIVARWQAGLITRDEARAALRLPAAATDGDMYYSAGGAV